MKDDEVNVVECLRESLLVKNKSGVGIFSRLNEFDDSFRLERINKVKEDFENDSFIVFQRSEWRLMMLCLPIAPLRSIDLYPELFMFFVLLFF